MPAKKTKTSGLDGVAMKKYSANFAQIDKKLSDMERSQKQILSRMDDFQKLSDIAKYNFYGIGTKITEIEGRIEGVEKRPGQKEIHLENYDKNFTQIEKKFHELEDGINAIRKSGTGKHDDNLSKNFIAIEKKFEEIDEKLERVSSIKEVKESKKLPEESLSKNFLSIERKFDDIEKEIESLKSMPMPETKVAAAPKGAESLSKNFIAIEQKFDDIDSRFGRIEGMITSGQSMTAQDRDIESVVEAKLGHAFSRISDDTVRTVSKKISDLMERNDERVREVEDLIGLLELEIVKMKEKSSALSVSGMVTPEVPPEYDDRLEALERRISEISKKKGIGVDAEGLEDEIDDIEHRFKREISRLEDMILGKTITKEGAEKYTEKMKKIVEELRHEAKRAELIRGELMHGSVTKSDLEKLRSDVYGEIKKVGDDVDEIVADIDKVSATERSLDNKFIDMEEKIMGMFGEEKTRMQQSINDERRIFAKELNKERDTFVKEVAARRELLSAETDKELQGIDRKMKVYDDMMSKKMTKYDEELNAQEIVINDMKKSQDLRALALEERVQDMVKKEARKDFDDEMKTHRKEIADLKAHVNAELSKISPVLTDQEVHRLLEKVNRFEKELEMIIMKEVDRHITDFAVNIDKKFPDLLTKDDFNRWADSVAVRIKAIEVPDVTPLAQRIDILERRVSEIANTFRLMATRLPVVIE